MLAENSFGCDNSVASKDDTATSSLCRVCGDRASGNHFGVLSCEACRSFFRRSVRVSSQYACRGTRSCPVTAKTRNRCPFCRLQKCIAVGMKRQDAQEERPAAPPTYYTHVVSAPTYWAPPTTFPSPQAVVMDPMPFSVHAMPGYPVQGHSGLEAQHLMQLPNAHKPVSPEGPGACDSHKENTEHGEVGSSLGTTGYVSTMGPPESQPEAFSVPQEPLVQSSIAQLPDVVVDKRSSEKPPSTKPAQVPVAQKDTLIAGPDVPLADIDLDALIESHNALFKFPTQVKEETGVDLKPLLSSAKQSMMMLSKWLRTIPTFMQLALEDRIKCLKTCWIDQAILSLVFRSFVQAPGEGLLFHNGVKLATSTEINHSLASYSAGRIMGELMAVFKDLEMDYKEFVVIRLLVLLSPDTPDLDVGVKTQVQQIQDQLLMTLEEYCNSKDASNIQRFGKLLLALASMKSIVQEVSQEGEIKRLLQGASINDEMFKAMCTKEQTHDGP